MPQLVYTSYALSTLGPKEGVITMKIQVNKTKLIAAINTKLKAADEEYSKSLKEWEDACEVVRKQWLERLADLSAEIKAKRFSPEYGPRWDKAPYWPSKPGKPTFKHSIESLIRKLELVDGEVIEIDDKSDYFAFI